MSDAYAVIGNPIGHTKSPLIHGLFAQTTEETAEGHSDVEGVSAKFCDYCGTSEC